MLVNDDWWLLFFWGCIALLKSFIGVVLSDGKTHPFRIGDKEIIYSSTDTNHRSDFITLLCLISFWLIAGESGVFKAKEGRKETRGASEIQETRETAIDLPIDQIAAEEVEDEVEDQVEPPIPDEAVVDPSSARDDVHIQEEPADNSYGQSSKEVLVNSISGVHQEENNNNSNLFDEDADPFGLKGGDLFEEKDNTFGGKTQSLEEEPEKEDVKEEAVQGSGAESPEKVGEEVIDIEDVEETGKTEDDKAVTEEDQVSLFLSLDTSQAGSI